MRFDPLYMTNERRELFLTWLKNEGLDPSDIINDGRFSVHNGWITGYKFLKSAEGRVKVRRDGRTLVLIHFRQPQKHPLPEELM